jgi:annexin A7/11
MTGTVQPKSPFDDQDAETVAKSLHTAMKGIGTDEKRLIKELCSISNEQRQLVKARYITMYGKALDEHIKSETGGYLEKILVALLRPSYEYEALCIQDAVNVSAGMK